MRSSGSVLFVNLSLPFLPECKCFKPSPGSTFLDEHHDSQRALQYWRAAADIRDKFRLAKRVLPAKPQYCWVKEFTTRAELEGLALDLDAMRTQSLLICERILGTVHKDMIYR